MNPSNELSRLRVWQQFLSLACLRLLGRGQFDPIRLRHPALVLHAAKNPWGLYREVFLREYYRPRVSLGEAPRILDLGANIGIASLYFLSRWPRARIEAYEPNPASFAFLQRNLTASAFPQADIRLHAAALSTSVATAEFLVPAGNPTSVCAGLSGAAPAGSRFERVVVPTADARAVFAAPADVVKLDIEGHEYDVLEHALPRAGVIRSLVVEFHEMDRQQARCEALLRRLVAEGGYQAEDEDGRALDAAAFSRRTGARHARFFARD